MIPWEPNPLEVRPAGLRNGAAPPGVEFPETPGEREEWERQWRAGLRKEMGMAALFYTLAHLLFSFHRLVEGVPSTPTEQGLGQVLFLMGMLFLWKVARTLSDPTVTRRPIRPAQAACCLAAGMLLSFSPCIWFLLGR